MSPYPELELWFLTGTQHLYGPETLAEVARDAEKVANALDLDPVIPLRVVFKPILTGPDGIRRVCLDASADDRCAGVITWMHTFSPAKMWINGLKVLTKPICHFHTQFHRDIPWDSIDMDYMNLHQSAHGGREFGFIGSRMDLRRKVVVGHWEDADARAELGAWARVAAAWQDIQTLKVVRFGDNMRQVAVTEGDKVEAEIVFGMSVNTHGIGDLVTVVNGISDSEVDRLCREYEESYDVMKSLRKGGDRHDSLRTTARIEAGLRQFLTDGGFGAFTDTFEDLHGLDQLPGLPVQRLMAEGYGFGGEGDWKHAALVRTLKTMTRGADRGTSFMEDYTYHLHPDGMRCLGAHMLEICPSIAKNRPRCEVHPLGIGGKADPVRLVFDGHAGKAVNVSLIDLGHRFRLLVNRIDAVETPAELPKLPVARVLWDVKPDLKTGAASWIQAGGAHHTCFSYSVEVEQLVDFAEIAGVELVVIDEKTELRQLRQELRWSEAYFGGRRP